MDGRRFDLDRWRSQLIDEIDIRLDGSQVRGVAHDGFDPDRSTDETSAATVHNVIGDRYGVAGERVTTAIGLSEANYLVYRTLLDADSHAVVVAPTYQTLETLPSTLRDVTWIELEPPEWSLDTDAVGSAIRPATDLVVVTTPNDPTGQAIDDETIDRIYADAAPMETYVLGDEACRPLAADPHDPVATRGQYGISVSALGKAWGLPGVGVGWVVGPSRVIDDCSGWDGYAAMTPLAADRNVTVQALAEADALTASARTHVHANREHVAGLVAASNLTWREPIGPAGFLTVPARFDSAVAFCTELVARTGVLLLPGEAVDCPGHARIDLGAPESTVREGVTRIGQFLT